MQPRIYTYKITFGEVPYWYWGVHKEKKFEEFYLGSPETHRWMWEFYLPRIQILEFFPCTEEGWKEANSVEKRLIRPDLDNPLCLNENCGGVMSLAAMAEGGRNGMKTLHKEKDDRGKSKHAVKMSKSANAEKDELGRSVLGVKNAERLNSEKDEFGRSLVGVRTAELLNSEKDELGRSVVGVRSMKNMHKEKDELGRSMQGVRNAERLNSSLSPEEKTARSKKAGKITSSQVWESTIDGFRSNAATVARHNRSRGWDPDARRRIG